MASTSKSKNGFTVTAYQGDFKTLLAFNLASRKSATNLAGFTIQCQPKGKAAYFLFNSYRFETPADHTQVATEPPNSSINAPVHKFRWVHYPGSFHQGTSPAIGTYTYTVTPRFFDSNQSLLPIDPARSVPVTIDVEPFTKKSLEVGFARGFTQSQAFVHHFGKDAIIRPAGKELLFDTTQVSGTSPAGKTYTFADEYEWLGFTARKQLFALLDEVLGNKNLRLDVCAYDLNEPDIMEAFLTLAGQGRIRMILDNASLHHNATTPKPEDQFEAEFTKAAKAGATIVRGKFGNFAHNKLLIVSNTIGAVKVLSGSTNFSVTGVYVNSNHVLVFNDKKVAAQYLAVFEESLTALAGKKSASVFAASSEGTQTFAISSTPKAEITFSPHDETFAQQILDGIVARLDAEGKKAGGSVLFAVMQLSVGTGPVIPALKALHASQSIFTYGISDSPGGIALYSPGRKTGVLVTGKPGATQLPPPFDQMADVIGPGHQVHHKFIVCGFNSPDAVVYCGSSNLALGGEQNNGDNLIAIHDRDVAIVFAIEALQLVDHFNFLDQFPKPKSGSTTPAPGPDGGFLSTTDKWVDKFFDPNDLRSMDRKLFG